MSDVCVLTVEYSRGWVRTDALTSLYGKMTSLNGNSGSFVTCEMLQNTHYIRKPVITVSNDWKVIHGYCILP